MDFVGGCSWVGWDVTVPAVSLSLGILGLGFFWMGFVLILYALGSYILHMRLEALREDHVPPPLRRRKLSFSVRSTHHIPTRRVHLYSARKLRLRHIRAQQRSAALAAVMGISSDDDVDTTSVEQLSWTFSQWGLFVLRRRIRAASLFHRTARLSRAARAYRFGSDRELQGALHTFASAVAEHVADDAVASFDVDSTSEEEASA